MYRVSDSSECLARVDMARPEVKRYGDIVRVLVARPEVKRYIPLERGRPRPHLFLWTFGWIPIFTGFYLTKNGGR